MKKGLRWVAAVAILLNGLEHLNVAFIDEPHEYLGEYRHIGFLMIIGVYVSFVVAFQLFRGSSLLAWLLGAAVSVGQAVGLVLSRTVGLFGFFDGGYSQEGKITLVLTVAYLIALGLQIWKTPELLREPRLVSRERAKAPAGVGGS